MVTRRLRDWLATHRSKGSTTAGSKRSQVTLGQHEVEASNDELNRLVAEIKDWQLTHGFLLRLVRLEEPTTFLSKPVNVSIEPTSFPNELFNEARKLQQIYNELYMRIACDSDWLCIIFKKLARNDDLARALLDIYRMVDKAGAVQDTICGIFRSDYMIDKQPKEDMCSLKQIEMNTFSVAGACHAERAARMHKHLHRINQLEGRDSRITGLPNNGNTKSLIEVLRQADNAYSPVNDLPTCVLMVVQPYNFNIADERPVEYGLWDAEIPCYRCTWQEVLVRTELESDRTLTFQESQIKHEVSVVYYRAGYEAKEYDPAGVDTRLRLELSRAIKCPDVLTHMTTFKAVQAALTAPGALERFLSTDQARIIRKTFVLNLPLGDDEALKIALDASKVENYVLKPNREGGRHGMYGAYIPGFLTTLPKQQYGKYVLMALVQAPEQPGILLSPNELYQGPVVSELGVIGTCLWRRDHSGSGVSEIFDNIDAGWTFKSKAAHVNEMNVVKGNGCFDCPRLLPGG